MIGTREQHTIDKSNSKKMMMKKMNEGIFRKKNIHQSVSVCTRNHGVNVLQNNELNVCDFLFRSNDTNIHKHLHTFGFHDSQPRS